MHPVLRGVIATVQGLGGLLLLVLVARAFEGQTEPWLLALYVLFLLVAAAACLGAVLLLLDVRFGWQLSTALQALQVPQWTSALLGYKLVLGASLVASIEAGAGRFSLGLEWQLPASAFRLYVASSDPGILCGINLLALWFTVLLLRGYARRWGDAATGHRRHSRALS